MRCEVTVLEQEPEKRAIAEISGCHSVQNIEEILTEHTAGEYRFLFHTIPVMIWKEAALKELPAGMTIKMCIRDRCRRGKICKRVKNG